MAQGERAATGGPRGSGARLARVGKIVAGVIGGAVLCAIFLFAAAFGFLQTSPGGRLLRKIALDVTNRQISGHLDLGEVRFGGRSLELRDAVLRDPEGRPAATCQRVFVSFELGGLLRHRVHLPEIAIEGPSVDVWIDDRGANVARALAPRRPSAAEPKTASRPWRIDVDRFVVEGGAARVTLAPAPGTETRHFFVDELDASLAAHLETSLQDVKARFSLQAETRGFGPERQALSVHLDVTRAAARDGRPAMGQGGGAVHWGDVLAVAFTLEGPNEGELVLERLRVPPALGASLVPSWPLKVTPHAEGTVRVDAASMALELQVGADATAGLVRADGDVSRDGRSSRHGLRLRVEDLRLSDWLVAVPPSPPLALQLTVEPGRLTPDALTGALRLEVPRASFRGHAAGPLHLVVRAEGGALAELEGRWPLPGARVTAEGKTVGDTTLVKVGLDVADAHELGRAVSDWRGAGGEPSPLSGRGQLWLTAMAQRPDRWENATWRASAAAVVPWLRSGTQSFKDFTLEADAPELTRLHQALHLKARLAAPLPVSFEAAATLNRVGQGASAALDVALSQLELTYPQARWRLARAARGLFGGDAETTHAFLHDFEWRDESEGGGSALTADVDLEKDAWNGRVAWKGLDLARLPLPAKVLPRGLEGRVDLQAAWSGPVATPRLDARLTVREGALPPAKHLSANLEARVADDRTLSGQLVVHALPLGRLQASWRGPVLGAAWMDGPLEAKVDLSQASLAAWPVPLSLVDLAGTLALDLGVTGPPRAPHVTLHVEGRALVLTPLRVSAADKRAAGVDKLSLPLVTADLDYRDPTLVVRSKVRDAAGGRLELKAQSHVAMKELLARDPRLVARLRQRPLHGRLVMKSLDPAAVALFVPSLRRVEGRLTATLALAGTAADPSVKGELRWKDGGVVTAHEGATPPHDEASSTPTSSEATR